METSAQYYTYEMSPIEAEQMKEKTKYIKSIRRQGWIKLIINTFCALFLLGLGTYFFAKDPDNPYPIGLALAGVFLLTSMKPTLEKLLPWHA